MATIDIGKLTFTHKGDYAGGTAYVANDVVYYNGSAYVAKTSTTGNLPTSTAHWNTFAAGSGGIWNSGLSLGSAGQSVKVNAAGNALEFGTISSEFVKIASGSHSGTALELDNIFTSDYTRYKVYLHSSTMPGYLNFQLRSGGASGTTSTASEYRYVTRMWYRNSSTSGSTGEHAWNDDKMRIGWQGSNTTDKRCSINMFVDNPYANDMKFICGGLHHQYQHDNVTVAMFSGANDTAASTRWTGLRFYDSGNNSFVAEYAVHGIKS